MQPANPLHSFCHSAASALVLALLLSNAALAQVVPQAFLGTWSASWQTDRKSYDATMTLTETGGTWHTLTRDRNNSCAGREVPIKVASVTDGELQLVLQFSEALAGCPNATVTLKATPDGIVSGTRSKFELKMARK